MAFVLIASLPAGRVTDQHGAPIVGADVHVYAHGTTTPVQVYANEAGTVPRAQPLATTTLGAIPGYLADGQYVDLVVTVRGVTQAPIPQNVVSASDVSDETARAQAAEALKQDAATAATDVELAAHANLTTTAHGGIEASANKGTPTGYPDNRRLVANVKDYGAVGDGATDDSVAFQAAHDAVVATGGVMYAPRGTYVLNTPLTFARNNTGWVRLVGDGVGATVVKAGGTNGQLTKFNKVADYDTFRYIEIADLTFDCNNQPTGRGHILIGSFPWGGSAPQQRLHLNNIAVRRVRAINVPLGGAGTKYGVFLVAATASSADTTELQVTDVLLEDVRIDGGESGFAIYGTVNSGSTDDGANKVYLDRIFMDRCYWDSGVVPTSQMAGGFAQIGGVGYGGQVRIRDCYGANSTDIGIEVDGIQDCVISGCRMVDCYKNAYLFAGFGLPPNPNAQRIRLDGCIGRYSNIDPSLSGADAHLIAVAQGSNAWNAVGAVEIVGFQARIDSPLASWTNRGHVLAANAQFRKLTIRDMTIGVKAAAITNSATSSASMLDIVPTNTNADVLIDGVTFSLAGTRSGGGNLTTSFIRVCGNTRADIRNVTFENQITGMTTGTDSHHLIRLGDLAGSNLKALIRGLRVVAYGSTASVNGISVSSTSTLAIGGVIEAVGVDMSGAPNGAGLDYNVDSTQRGKFIARAIEGVRTGGSGPPAPGSRTAISPGASPYTYLNADNIEEDVLVYGGTVSAIDYSHDNSTFNVLGLTAGVFRLGPGNSLKVTYSVAPTMFKLTR
jgi:hypothetical protein